MSARQNIASPLAARRVEAAEAVRRVEAVAKLLRISHVLEQAPRALSNGQKQRTALARALVGNPHVLLLDDPLRNVDAKLRYEMRLELPRLLRRSGAATIYVSQDYREAMALGDRVAILLDGRIAQSAPPEAIYDAPANLAVARLFGDPPINLLPCRPTRAGAVIAPSAAGLSIPIAGETELAGRDCLLGVRPETLSVTPAESGAVVIANTPLHERQVLLLRAEDGTELVASVIGAPPAPGSHVAVTAAPGRALLFDSASGLLLHAPTQAAATAFAEQTA
jgi:multiple sugar transport system ATP-binding protein